MTMFQFHRRRESLYGALLGAWLGIVYAFTTQAINWIFLSEIPLAEPDGGLFGYLARYVLLGMLFGFIIGLPENRLAAAGLGGLAAAVISSFFALAREWGFEFFGSTVVTVLIMFLPLIVLFLPLALFLRIGIDSQHIDPTRPYLWPRRYIIPALLTFVVILAGSFSLYPASTRTAFRVVDQLIKDGLAASIEDQPVSLNDVLGFAEKAESKYTLAWSDRIDTFMGPRPVGGELSQFLIIARFQNGFAFVCIFSENRSVQNCTNY